MEYSGNGGKKERLDGGGGGGGRRGEEGEGGEGVSGKMEGR